MQLGKGEDILPVFRRRLWLLLGFGVVHAVFIWSDDILTTYALIGFLLIAFRDRAARNVLRWVIGLSLLSILIFWGLLGLEPNLAADGIEEIARTYAQGAYLDVTVQRLEDLGLVLLSIPIYLPQVLSLFLLGLLCGRYRLLEQIEIHRSLETRILALFVGLCSHHHLHTLIVLATETGRGSSLLTGLDLVIGSPALGFAYFSGLVLLLAHTSWQRRLAPLAAVRRMALTNYLMQSVVMTLVFYGYGFSLSNRLHIGWDIILSLALFTLQMTLSTCWLKYFSTVPPSGCGAA